jgi:hypothetical protein
MSKLPKELKLNAREKTVHAGEKFEDFKTHFRIKFNEAPHIVGQLYGVPHGILRVIITILYENEFSKSTLMVKSLFTFLFVPGRAGAG